MKKRILFVCVENSFRSQIAEAYFNKLAPENMVAFSAGTRPAERVHPNAVRLMLEEGIDISGNKPKLLTREMQENADVAVIVCGGSECPLVFASHVEEWNMPDPANMPLDEARKVRDAIR
ncbi:MAG: arsenate reductase ArsC, partial [Candidatus Jordarchaeales archaeon]